jgi:hypothetical protein
LPKSTPAALELARKYVALLYALGDVQIIPQKTRLVCVASELKGRLQESHDTVGLQSDLRR